MKSFIKILFFNKFTKQIFNILFIHKFTIKYINYFYEHSNDIFVEVIVRLFKRPKFNYTWVIFLKNKKKIRLDVMKDNPRSCDISLSYKWHDRPLRDLEIIVNNFYDLKYYSLDIGANHGMRSFYALSLGRPVILFEPNSSLNDFTISLFNKNSFKNFKLENLCISDRINELDFYISENTYESSLIEFENHAKKMKVKCISMDQYVSSQKLSIIPKIIKIDVEGSEYEVIKGAKDLILTHEPSIFVEILPNSKNRNDTMNELFSLGYSCVALENGIFRSKYIKLNNNNNLELSKKCTNYFFTKENSILELIHLSK